jgi:hypothetical protein
MAEATVECIKSTKWSPNFPELNPFYYHMWKKLGRLKCFSPWSYCNKNRKYGPFGITSDQISIDIKNGGGVLFNTDFNQIYD